MPGNAEHPLSTSYGGTDNLLKVDSLVEGDLNQFKKVVFDTPLKRLVTEYNSPNVSPARQEEIKAIANSRKNFLNYAGGGYCFISINNVLKIIEGSFFKIGFIMIKMI